MRQSFRNRFTYGSLSLFACLLMGALVLAAEAQMPSLPLPPDRAELDFWPSASSTAQPARSAASGGESPLINPEGLTAYQVFRSGSWDIEVDDFYDFKKLVASTPSSDLFPSVKAGSLDIAFASNQVNEQYDIFVVNKDGENLRRLTQNPERDSYPDWSRSGEQIVYESIRNGIRNIFVMDDDGANKRQITNSADYDGTPDWSPDGQQIAFSSRRTGGFRIYVMNSDGSDVRQVSTAPFSFRPKWSPDGSQIVFDADVDNDGWQELMIVNADGSGQRTINDPGLEYDVWANDWKPNGKVVYYTLVEYIFYQGNYYLEALRLRSTQPDVHNVVPYSKIYYAAQMSQASQDTLVPRSTIVDLPRYAQPDTFFIEWQQLNIAPTTDGQLDDVHHFDIEMRSNAESEWKSLISQTAEVSTLYQATFGETIHFRSRAVDNVYNIEPWPSSADASTTFVSQPISGQIVDNLGVPIAHLPAGLDIATLQQDVKSDASGHFDDFTVEQAALTFAPASPNYATFAAQQFSADVPSELFAYLPPENNLIANGGFEETGVWQYNKLGDASEPTAAHSGQQGGRLGVACDYPCLEQSFVSWDINRIFGGGIGPNGEQHLLVFMDSRWHHAIRPNGNTDWTFEPLITNDGFPLAMEVTKNGDVHILLQVSYGDEETVAYLHQPEGEEFQIYLDNRPTYAEHAFIQNGRPTYITFDWTQATSSISTRIGYFENGGWQHQLVPVQEDARYGPIFAAHWNDAWQLHLVWQARIEAHGGQTGIWSGLFNFDSNYQHIEAVLPYAELDPASRIVDDGTAHLVYQNTQVQGAQLEYRRSSNGFVSPAVLLPEAETIEWIQPMPKQAVEFVFRTEQSRLFSTIYSPASGQLSPIQEIDAEPFANFYPPYMQTSDGFPLIAMLNHHLGWRTMTRTNADEAAKHTVSQQITIPSSMSNPTLSWVQKGNGDRNTDKSFLFVAVDGSQIYSDVTTIEWALHSLSMDAWAGQTISVTFGVEQAAGEPVLQVDLDDIALGSAYTNLWAQFEGADRFATVGDQLAISLTIGNRSPILAEGIEVRVEMPAGLALIQSMPPVSSSGSSHQFEVGTLAQHGLIRIDLQVEVREPMALQGTRQLTATVTHVDTEAALADNVSHVNIIYAKRHFLPLIARSR